MEIINNILLLVLACTLSIHVGPFLKGFYDGYKDAQSGKPPKDLDPDL
jgi:hypothetical protein